MNKTTLQIKMLYDKMGGAEKRVADWLIKNPGKIISLSISELAEECKCGEATLYDLHEDLGLVAIRN